MISAMLANQQFQNQLKNLDPTQQKQLEQLLRAKQSQIPAHVMTAIQSQLRSLQTPPAQSTPSPAANTTAANLAKTLAQMGGLNQLSGKLNPQMLQQIQRTLQQHAQQQAGSSSSTPNRASGSNPQRKVGGTLVS